MQKPVHRIHFLGVCGTAMGAVAAALRELGIIVTGSDDNVYPPMSTFLEAKGIEISRGFRPENIPSNVEITVEQPLHTLFILDDQDQVYCFDTDLQSPVSA